MAALHHALGGGARQAEIGFQVDLDHRVPVFVLHAQDQAVAGDAGIGDQNVETGTGGVLGPRDQAVDRGGVGQVGGGDDRARQFGGQVGQHVFARARQHDLGALFMQGAGDFSAQPAGGARDEGGLAGQFEHGVSPENMAGG